MSACAKSTPAPAQRDPCMGNLKTAPSAAGSTYREYASPAAYGRRLATGPFSPPGDVSLARCPTRASNERHVYDGRAGRVGAAGDVARRVFACAVLHEAVRVLLVQYCA